MTVLFEAGDACLDQQENTLHLIGDVDVVQAADIAQAGLAWLSNGKGKDLGIRLDLSQVRSPSTAALSILLQWVRRCHEGGIRVNALTLSLPLQQLASLAELDDVIAMPS